MHFSNGVKGMKELEMNKNERVCGKGHVKSEIYDR